MAKLHLAPFDRDREFIAQRDFMCRGKEYRRGDPFPIETLTTRTGRILYEGRAIGYPDPKPELPARRVPRPMSQSEKDNMLLKHTRPALMQMVSKLGVTIDRSWSKAELVEEYARYRRGAANR